MTAELHECGDCGRAWTALGEAHCAGCCRHFSSDSAFDKHQRLDHGPCASRPENRKQPHKVCYARSVCLDPATLPSLEMTRTRFGPMWSRVGHRPPETIPDATAEARQERVSVPGAPSRVPA